MKRILSISLNLLSLLKPASQRPVWIAIQNQRISRNPDFPYTPLWLVYLFCSRINRIAALRVLRFIHFFHPHAWTPLSLILRFYVLEYPNIPKAQLLLRRWLDKSPNLAPSLSDSCLQPLLFDEDRPTSSQYISNYLFSSDFFKNKTRIIKPPCCSEDLSLFIDLPGYIGNALIQLMNAIFLAELCNISYIYILPTDEVVENFLQKPLCENQSNIKLIFGAPDKGVTIASSFFYLESIAKDFNKPSFRVISQEIARRFEFSPADIPSDNSLTIHVRSGDIFTDKAHYYPSYGQPPLSYYVLCIQYQKPSSIVLVYEDLGNPIIEELISYLQSKDIPFTLVSGSTKNDFMTLVAARNLVLSFGTFGPLSMCFNPSLINVFVFNDMNQRLIFECMSSDSSLYSVADLNGRYTSEVLNNNWANTDSQRDLMLSYGVENLHLSHWGDS